MALAALVTALHVLVPARRLAGRDGALSATPTLAWSAESGHPAGGVSASARTSSRPAQNFSVGWLALAAGMAVIILAWWLHIMHVGGSADF